MAASYIVMTKKHVFVVWHLEKNIDGAFRAWSSFETSLAGYPKVFGVQ